MEVTILLNNKSATILRLSSELMASLAAYIISSVLEIVTGGCIAGFVKRLIYVEYGTLMWRLCANG